MLTPLPDSPVSASRISSKSTAVAFSAASAALTFEATVSVSMMANAPWPPGRRTPAMASNTRGWMSASMMRSSTPSPPWATPSSSASSTDAVVPPITVRYRPRLTVPHFTKAMGAFFSIASVANMPVGMSRNSTMARAGCFFIR